MTTKARFLILWDQPSDPAAFDRHYRNVHIPLATKLPGLRRYTISRNVSVVRGGAPHYLIAELDFDDTVALRAAFQSPEGRATSADVANLTVYANPHGTTYELEDQ